MKRILVMLLLAALAFACSESPDQVVGPSEPEISIDSLLWIIDMQQLTIARKNCIIRCFRATLDSLRIPPRCECGY